MPAVGRSVLVGFDSAWTDNPRDPGGVCAMRWSGDAPPVFHPPRLARFDAAERFVAELGADADLLLVAIDQPTVVPNATGSRPVDRIAAGLIGRLKGGVQPACRDGFGARMFGDDAPIWRFLRRLELQQDPQRCRTATEGRFAIEVYPALALPALVPLLFERGRGAKYNPSVRDRFLIEDWQLVCDGLADAAASLALDALEQWARTQRAIPVPRKADQDRLDAALCLLIASHWRQAAPEHAMVIGSLDAGYVVTPASTQTRAILEAASRRVDGVATAAAVRSPQGPPPVPPSSPSPVPPSGAPPKPIAVPPLPSLPSPVPATGSPPGLSTRMSAIRPPGPGREQVDAELLRCLLIGTARQRALLTYGEVADRLGFRFHQGFVSSLTRALRQVSEQNRALGEPQLMCLVVSRSSRIPGAGFFNLVRPAGATVAADRRLFEAERRRCQDHCWP